MGQRRCALLDLQPGGESNQQETRWRAKIYAARHELVCRSGLLTAHDERLWAEHNRRMQAFTSTPPRRGRQRAELILLSFAVIMRGEYYAECNRQITP